ncbi:hypothetical protein PM082_006231 [Marasmius tenuissimus]|nr:hypothetical protein PM082_006231 [Marasmius tenuissimus]
MERQRTETETRGMQIRYYHSEQHENETANNNQAMEEPHLTDPVNLHSIENAHPYQFQDHPGGHNANQEHFPYPHLFESSLGEACDVDTPTPITSNLPYMLNNNAHTQWLGMPQYTTTSDLLNESAVFSSAGADRADLNNISMGNTANSAYTTPSTPFVDTNADAARYDDNPAQSVGWSEISQVTSPATVSTFPNDSITFEQAIESLGMLQLAPMAGPYDVPLTSNSRRAGTTNFDDGFGGSSAHTGSTRIFSVGTATEAARYFDLTAQSVEWDSSHLALSGPAGTVDAVDGYPHSHPTQVDMGLPNSTIQGYLSLLGDEYASFSPYHAGGPSERSQEQSRGQNHDPGTAPYEQPQQYWNGWSGSSNGSGNIAGGW